MDCGKYKFVLEYEMFYDKVMIEYAINLESGASKCLMVMERSRLLLVIVFIIISMGWVKKSL